METKGKNIKNNKILFIEDDADQIMIYKNKFSLEGLELISVEDNKNIIETADKEKPSLILLDLLLGNEDGLDILKKLKEEAATKNIPVITFTNFDTPETRNKSVQLGAIDYIVKAQITPSQMVEKVKRILEK